MAFSNLGSASYVELSMASEDDSVINLQPVKDIAAHHNRTPA